MTLQESAPAKVNLTLKILGKRSDGFHQLISLVAFASVGDVLELVPAGEISLRVEGPFASGLGEHNLVLAAANALLERCPGRRAGAFALDKQLPIAAGLGGGSADAAAALRLMARATPESVPGEIITAAARQLGADVPVCLGSQACVMRGRGEQLSHVPALPVLPAVLVNPGVALATQQVYAALEAPALQDAHDGEADVPASFGSADELAAYIQESGNDLEATAIELAPVIAEVRAALHACAGCRLAQMSGSGPTCFGIFASADEARIAAQIISRTHPRWWAVATQLG